MTQTTLEHPQSRLLAGVERTDITPPVGIYHRMWGAAAHDRSTGVHRPLTATALAMQSTVGGPRWIALAVDHCLLWHEEMNTLLDRVSERSGLARDQLTVFFSHTHAAGLMGLERTEMPGGDLIPEYLDQLATRLSEAATAAVQRLRPATIVYANGRCSLGRNRDFQDPDGTRVCGLNPDGVGDDTVVVGRISDDEGEVLGTVVNYACHPTTLAWDNTLISPDFVGAMRETVERATSAPCFFIQGASGDIGPRDGFVGDVEVADRNGRQLGYAALEALESAPPAGMQLAYTGPVISGATLGAWHYEPVADAERLEMFSEADASVELPYRKDLTTKQGLLDERQQWQAVEQAARKTGDEQAAADARAMLERITRRLVRVKDVPPGDAFPYRLRAWRMGRAVWLAFNGEHYNVLQRELRRQFPDLTLIVGTLANGSDVWYVLDEQSYGQGLYQEEASILARGSLEQLIDTASQLISRIVS